MTHEERRVGLMSRTSLPEEDGMLFIFDKERIHKFWMKDMIIPLDVIWIDEKGIIVHIDKNVMPCDEYCKSFGPELSTKFVLELKYTCPFCGGNNTDLASKKNAKVRFICHYCLKSFGDYGHGFVID